MTVPRQVLPGSTYLVTRRCLHRRFLLRPTRATSEVFLFVLALAARRFGVQVHVFCVLSNHYHLVVSDPHARLPAFQQLLDALVARAVNAMIGRWETFWAPSSYSAVRLETPRDVVEKAGYVLANPVAAGLVRSGSQWPGLWSDSQLIGTSIEAPRPAQFFDPKGTLPATETLNLTPPPGFATAEEFRALLRAEWEERERTAVARHTSFLGVRRVMAQQHTHGPAAADPRRTLNPRIAARDRWKRIEAIARLVAFLKDYRAAWQARREGREAVIFPAGTYLLRVLHGVACEGFG